MTVEKIVRAWRDPLFRSSLDGAERALLPDNPAGMIELHGTALDAVAGASAAAGSGSSVSHNSSKSSKSSKSGSSKSHKSSKSC
jgi:mersacidin/lichenicidin family type 2 lantibiotic